MPARAAHTHARPHTLPYPAPLHGGFRFVYHEALSHIRVAIEDTLTHTPPPYKLQSPCAGRGVSDGKTAAVYYKSRVGVMLK